LAASDFFSTIAKIPKLAGHASSHRRRYAQHLMDTCEGLIFFCRPGRAFQPRSAFSNSQVSFKQPSLNQASLNQTCVIARILCGAGYADRMSGLPDIRHSKTVRCPLSRGLPLSPSHKARGRSAERRILSQLTPCGAGTRCDGCAPIGAPSRLFCPRARASRFRGGFVALGAAPFGQPRLASTKPVARLLLAKLLAPGSSCPEGGVPRPPGCGVTSPARRRRILAPLNDAS